MTFEIHAWGLFFLLLLLLLFALLMLGIALLLSIRRPQSILSTLFFSDLQSLESSQPSLKESLAPLPRWLLYGALGMFCLALSDPYIARPQQPFIKSPLPREGVAIYLVVDQSGSMAQKQGTFSKIDLLKRITTQFVEGRSQDLIGLIAFARTAHILSPLTFDHSAIIKELQALNVVQKEAEDGTAIGYAIFKTVNILAATRHYAEDSPGAHLPAYDLKSAIIILLTDGFHSPNVLDAGKRLRNIEPMEAAEYAKEKRVRLYVVNMEPALASTEFAPQRHLMERITKITGGKFFLMNSGMNLEQIYAEIDQLEKSLLPAETKDSRQEPKTEFVRSFSFYPLFIAIGMLCLLLSVVLNTTSLRRLP
jgi:Ca-activated chloride channel family protein